MNRRKVFMKSQTNVSDDVPQHEPVIKTFEDATAMVLEERRVIVEEMA